MILFVSFTIFQNKNNLHNLPIIIANIQFFLFLFQMHLFQLSLRILTQCKKFTTVLMFHRVGSQDNFYEFGRNFKGEAWLFPEPETAWNTSERSFLLLWFRNLPIAGQRRRAREFQSENKKKLGKVEFHYKRVFVRKIIIRRRMKNQIKTKYFFFCCWFWVFGRIRERVRKNKT